MNESQIGRPHLRTEDERFLTGRGCFVDDLRLPGMLEAVVVRSAVAHARIRRIDAAAARAMPGVAAVLTAGDIEQFARPIPIRLAPFEGFERFLQRPLAADCVRYVGEPLALVIAENRYVAEDAAERVTMEYDPLPALVDARRAIEDRVLVHPDATTNVAVRYAVQAGDVSPAFERAHYSRRETFRCHRHAGIPLETRGLLAAHDDARGRLTVWGATKVPFWNRRALAAMLEMPIEAIDLIETDIGGSFGVRGEFYPEDFLVPFAARILGRPVKWIEDRREHLMAANHSREIECALEIALDRDGTILGMRAELLADLGAYVRTNGGVPAAKAGQFLIGPYRVPHFACQVTMAVTNKTPVGTLRGPGRFEANFFRERLFDIACAETGLDRIDFRRRNLIRADEMPYRTPRLVPYEADTAYDTGDYPRLFERALATFGFEAAARRARSTVDGKIRGVGVGCFVESSGAGPAETARVVLVGPRSFDVFVGSASSGQGHETAMAQIAADVLGVPIANLRVHHGSTTGVPQGWGTYHSRAIVMGGSAVQLAATALARQLVALAASRTGVAGSALVFRDGAVRDDVTGVPALDVEALLREAAADPSIAARLEALATFEQTERTYTYGTHVAEIALDPRTLQVEVIDFLSVEDIGRAINPALVHGQAIGAAVQGLGGVLLDGFAYADDGQLLNASLADYLLPTATDFPRVRALSLEEAPSKLNPLGVKGAGEGGIVAVAAAVANAVADALGPRGERITALPLAPDALARALRDPEEIERSADDPTR